MQSRAGGFGAESCDISRILITTQGPQNSIITGGQRIQGGVRFPPSLVVHTVCASSRDRVACHKWLIIELHFFSPCKKSYRGAPNHGSFLGPHYSAGFNLKHGVYENAPEL